MVWKRSLFLTSQIFILLVLFPMNSCQRGRDVNYSWKCHKCHPGFYVAYQCTRHTGTLCSPCPAGTFNSHFNMRFQCQPCGRCPHGQFEQTPCNRERDTKCVSSQGGYQGDDPHRPGLATGSTVEDASGDFAEDKQSQFSNIMKIPGRAEGGNSAESSQEELSGDSPVKSNLFNLDSFEVGIRRKNVSARPHKEAEPATTISEIVTTAMLAENEAKVDHLIPVQKSESNDQATTGTVDTEGSAISTLAVEDYPEATTEMPAPPAIGELNTPRVDPEVQSTPSTTFFEQKLPEIVSETVVHTFNEIKDPLRHEVVLPNATEALKVTRADTTTSVSNITTVPTTTPNATPELAGAVTEVEVSSAISVEREVTSAVALLDNQDPGIEPETEPEVEEGSELAPGPSDKEKDPTTLVASTMAGTGRPSTHVDASTTAEPTETATVPLKKLVFQEGETIDEHESQKNKTQLARVIPLRKTQENLDVTTDKTSEEQEAEVDDEVDDSVGSKDLVTPEHTYPWINGSGLLQDPPEDNVASGEKSNSHVDVAIAAVLTGIGLIVLAVIAVRYFVKKRTFKDMRRAKDRIRIHMRESKKRLKRKDSYKDGSLQMAIYDDIEMQAVSDQPKQGTTEGPFKDLNGAAAPNADLMSAVNDNYRPISDTNPCAAESASTEDLHLSLKEQPSNGGAVEPLLTHKSQNRKKGETVTTPENNLYVALLEKTTDEERGEYIVSRLDGRRVTATTTALDEVNETLREEEPLLFGGGRASNCDYVLEESTRMIRGLTR